ncbi:C4-type zinc ribbon domain-containing protein [Microbacterium sp. X-17]|uniref:zinc ribbon domain-containing protein n=1 Tax=Microbacterium sp. X-17 TaxID=3144404 RepID=UPI0031F4CEA7
MNAAPADQRRLLEIADLDARIRRAEHERAHPPQAARIQELATHRQELSRELAEKAGARDDLKAELKRVESDVEVVDARRVRDESRLQAVTNPKDAQGLESELASLARRKSDLEDAELELMERLDAIEAAVGEQEGLIADTNAEGARLTQEAKDVVAGADAALDAARRDRAAVAGTIPAELVALYERLTARSAGAAPLVRQTCEGCRMVLSGTDLHTLRQTADDVVANCPECGCILVRTEESGL